MRILSVFLALFFLACGPKERVAKGDFYGANIQSRVDSFGNLNGVERGYDAQTGALLFERSWQKGKKNGVWRAYHPGNVLKYEGSYKDNRPVGVWRFYDRKGELIEEQFYDEYGKFLKSKTF